MPAFYRLRQWETPRRKTETSDISSDIAPAQAATAGKRKQADETFGRRHPEPHEGLGNWWQIVSKGRKRIPNNPCLPATAKCLISIGILQGVVRDEFSQPDLREIDDGSSIPRTGTLPSWLSDILG
jgi:hypothetical protein